MVVIFPMSLSMVTATLSDMIRPPIRVKSKTIERKGTGEGSVDRSDRDIIKKAVPKKKNGRPRKDQPASTSSVMFRIQRSLSRAFLSSKNSFTTSR